MIERRLKTLIADARALYVFGAAVLAFLTAAMVVTKKVEGLAAVPVRLDSISLRLTEHVTETKGINTRLDKLLCVETHFTAREKVACVGVGGQ